MEGRQLMSLPYRTSCSVVPETVTCKVLLPWTYGYGNKEHLPGDIVTLSADDAVDLAAQGLVVCIPEGPVL